MGMDVFGKNPTNEVGKYFRRNVWGWRPLWDYALDMHHEIAGVVRNGHSNSGDGLGSADSIKLANALIQDLEDGTAIEYINKRNARLAEIERHTCKWCAGTGIRTDDIGIENKMPERELEPEMAILLGRTHGWCNGCRGEGKTDDIATSYYLDAEDIAEFAEFLKNCGGFSIC